MSDKQKLLLIEESVVPDDIDYEHWRAQDQEVEPSSDQLAALRCINSSVDDLCDQICLRLQEVGIPEGQTGSLSYVAKELLKNAVTHANFRLTKNEREKTQDLAEALVSKSLDEVTRQIFVTVMVSRDPRLDQATYHVEVSDHGPDFELPKYDPDNNPFLAEEVQSTGFGYFTLHGMKGKIKKTRSEGRNTVSFTKEVTLQREQEKAL